MNTRYPRTLDTHATARHPAHSAPVGRAISAVRRYRIEACLAGGRRVLLGLVVQAYRSVIMSHRWISRPLRCSARIGGSPLARRTTTSGSGYWGMSRAAPHHAHSYLPSRRRIGNHVSFRRVQAEERTSKVEVALGRSVSRPGSGVAGRTESADPNFAPSPTGVNAETRRDGLSCGTVPLLNAWRSGARSVRS